MTTDDPGSDPPARQRSRAPSARTVARILLPLLLIGGMAGSVVVALDLITVRSSLQDARAAMAEVRSSLGDVEVDAAAGALERADEELADARRRTGRLTWSVASVAPFVGPSFAVTRDVVEVASSAHELVAIAVTDGQELLADGLPVRVVDGQVDLGPLLAAQELTAALPIERLAAARDDLARPRRVWLPSQIRAGRADTLELADATLTTVTSARALTDALPGFLGVDGPRRYFVGFQTSAELRGTGGLIGFWGVLVADDGRITFGQSEGLDPADDVEAADEGESSVGRIASIGFSRESPPDVDPAFFARYGIASAQRSFPNVNLDPDLPTTSKAMLDLFELQTGERLDGVVLLDPPGLERLLRATGDQLPISDALAAMLGVEGGLPTDGLARFITQDIYDTLGVDRKDDRRAALTEIGDTAFARIFDGQWDATTMLAGIADAATQRNLQVHVTDEATQAAFAEVGATGQLDVPDDADLFAVIANNVVGGKQDVHLGHEATLEVALTGIRRGEGDALLASRDVTLGVTVDNPLPTSGLDEYIIGSCYLPGEPNQCFEGEPGSNRTWFSLWRRPDSEVVGWRSDDDSRPGLFSKTYRGLGVMDHFQVTDSQTRRSFAYDARGEVPLQRATDTVVYELQWWRQAKATPDLLDITVRPPEDWAIVRVEVVGGGDGRGSGVHGDGVELTSDLRDGIAHLSGTVTADTRLRVHLGEPADPDDRA